MLGVVIKNNYGAPFFGINNRLVPGTSSRTVDVGEIACRLRNLPLMPDTYCDRSVFRRRAIDHDVIYEPSTFEVVAADVFGSGKLPARMRLVLAGDMDPFAGAPWPCDRRAIKVLPAVYSRGEEGHFRSADSLRLARRAAASARAHGAALHRRRRMRRRDMAEGGGGARHSTILRASMAHTSIARFCRFRTTQFTANRSDTAVPACARHSTSHCR